MPARLALRFVLCICLLAACSTVASGAPEKPKPTHADVAYGPHEHQRLDVFIPTEGEGPYPVVLWYGGLWKPAKEAPTHQFLKAKVAAVAVQTRVMQDAIDAKIFPPVSVCLLDGVRAVQFVRLHAKEWNLDPERIAVGGGSQGALPALFVGATGERAYPDSSDPVERVSSRVTGVGAFRCQPSIDPKRMQEWVPGVEWGAPAFGVGFAESLKRREEFLPLINAWSPEALLHKGSAPVYFENEWGLTQPDDEKVTKVNYIVHSPAWGLGFAKIARERGVVCYNKYPGHPTEDFADIWDFLIRQAAADAKK